jgi:hypothetical protein
MGVCHENQELIKNLSAQHENLPKTGALRVDWGANAEKNISNVVGVVGNIASSRLS